MKKKTKHIFITSVVLLLSITLFEYSDLDLWLQNFFYNFETGQWLLDRDEAITKFLFYDGIKKVIIAFVLLSLIGSLLFRNSRFVKNNKAGLSIVFLSAMIVPLTVGALKATTNVPCPKDLEYYGGSYPHITLLTPYPESFSQTENIRCYPAGHASGGFALLSLVFLFRKKRNKVIAAVTVLSVAWTMGAYKMLIGDHFLSHTVVTMILAWLIILIIAKGVYRFYGGQKNTPAI